MKLKIKFLSSENIEVDFNGKTIDQLKDDIAELKKKNKEYIKIIFAGQVLENDRTLESYKITDNTVIHCLIRNPIAADNQNISSTIPLSMPNSNHNINNSFSNLNNDLPSSNNSSGIGMPNNEQMQQLLTMLIQNPEMKSMLINLTLQSINITQESPMRSNYEQMLNNMFSNPSAFISIFNESNTQNMMNMFSNMNVNSFNFPTEMMQNETQEENDETVEENIQSEIQNDLNSEIQNDLNSEINQQSINDMSTIQNEEKNDEQHNEHLTQKYAEQIQQIKNMGFDDEDRIIEVLSQCSGSVSIALNKLFTD